MKETLKFVIDNSQHMIWEILALFSAIGILILSVSKNEITAIFASTALILTVLRGFGYEHEIHNMRMHKIEVKN